VEWLQQVFYFADLQRIWQGIEGRSVVLSALVLVLLAEIVISGWGSSSVAVLRRMKRTDFWDVFSFFIFMIGGRLLIANILFLGLLAVISKLTENMTALVPLGLPFWAEVILALIFADFLVYWTHRWQHESSWLWPMHEFHHSASKLSVWTSYRVHPLSVVVTLPAAILPQIFFGWDVINFLIFLLSAEAVVYLSHSRIDTDYGWLGRSILVSPRFHHLHHSVDKTMNKNYGTVFVFWDRIFGTYAEPKTSVDEIIVGLKENPFETAHPVRAFFMPFREFYRIPVAAVFKKRK
jgi:sterol desaturase/sphingolipid hydroxylase (fatty acid hydroxylase superfamily)